MPFSLFFFLSSAQCSRLFFLWLPSYSLLFFCGLVVQPMSLEAGSEKTVKLSNATMHMVRRVLDTVLVQLGDATVLEQGI